MDGHATWAAIVSEPTFRTRADGVTPGEGLNRKRGVTPFGPFASLFADDFAIFFETREDMVMGISYLSNYLRKFGLKMHVGSGTTASKTEAMYYPTSMVSCEDGDWKRRRSRCLDQAVRSSAL